MYKRALVIVLYISIMVLFSGCGLVTQLGENPPAHTPPPSPIVTEGSSSAEATPVPTKKPVPTLAPSPTVDPVILLLNSMTVEEKLGQLLIVGYNNDEQAEKMIKDHKIGGMVLYRRNYDDFEKLYQLTQGLKDLNQDSSFPLWIAMDEEGGTVTRLPPGKTPIPDARKVGSFEDLELTRATGWIIGRELAAAGVNLDFAPVVDIVSNPINTFMLKRCYGSTPQMVSDHGVAFLKGLHESGVLGCAKHFPGHGGTAVDSHKGMPVIETPLEEWIQHDAVPFQAMMDAGTDMIMVGHLAFPKIDSSGLPASMSPVFLKEQLRERMGYQGLIITDDIEMQGYPQTGSRQETIIKTFLAGVDLFAIGPTPETQLEVLDALMEGFEKGRISEERINESITRIIKAKAKLRQIPEFSLEEAKRIFGSDEHKDAASPLLNN